MLLLENTYIDPRPHGLALLADREGPTDEELAKAEARRLRIQNAMNVVSDFLEKMAAKPAWSRSDKKKAVALALAAMVGNEDELRMFMNAAYSDRDGEFVAKWAAAYFTEHHGLDVTNVTFASVIEELEEVIDAAAKRGGNVER